MDLVKLSKYMELPGGVQPVLTIKKGDIEKIVIVTNTDDFARLVTSRMSDVRKIPHRAKAWGVVECLYQTYTGKIDDIKASVCEFGWSAGQIESTLTELINVGAEVVIYCGCTGSYQENIKIGDLEIITGAVRDEGTSRYYAPIQYPAVADYYVTDALVRAAEKLGVTHHIGILRTTDGFYASQRAEEIVVKWNKLGVFSVEQELAAVYTICSTRGVRAGSVQAVTGNLIVGRHECQGDDLEIARKGESDAMDTTVEAVKILAQRLDLG